MRFKRVLASAVLFSLIAAFALGSAGCTGGIKPQIPFLGEAADLMEGIKSNMPETVPEVSGSDAKKAADFAVRLFKAAENDGENTLISPVSVLAALAMTANGAKGATLSEMEKALGMTVAELNTYFFNYLELLEKDEAGQLKLANSVWFTSDERFTVNRDFLQTNANYYGADVYKAPFDDTTLKDINDWVNDRTDGMIPDILDEIPAEAVMYLVNALAFEAEWEEQYDKNSIVDGTFTLEDGGRRSVTYMVSEEHRYLSDGKATGFIKYYKGGKYAFAALLPNDGVSVKDYLAYLDGEKLYGTLSSASNEPVSVLIPKFETEFEEELSTALNKMGIKAAFDSIKADFSGLGTSTAGNIFINRVLHKTYISVDEKGTKAGAATVVEMTDGCVMEEIRRVALVKPFVYMLIDTETNVPLFIGTATDIGTK